MNSLGQVSHNEIEPGVLNAKIIVFAFYNFLSSNSLLRSNTLACNSTN